MSWIFVGGSVTPPVFSNTKSTLFVKSSVQSINFGNVLDWTGGTPRTFSAWIKPTLGNSAIMGKGVHFGTGWTFYYGSNSINLYAPCSGGGTLYFNTTPITVVDGNWHHVALTTDGSKGSAGCIVYFDGSPITLVVNIDTLSGSLSNSRDFLIGNDEDGEAFDGNIDEPAIYDVVLSPSEITTISAAPIDLTAGPQSAHLIGWWRTGDSPDTGSTYFDASTGGHNGTPVNGPTIVSDVP